MKKIFFFVLAGLVLAACNNKADQPIAENDTVMGSPVYSWQSIINDSTGRLEMKKVEAVGPDTLSPAAVINFLNTTNSNVQLAFIKTSGDTIYIRIPDPMYLTQQMGSTGPTLYLSQVIYNLTEIPGIKYVTLDFEEGDHASPGTYNRDSFKDE